MENDYEKFQQKAFDDIKELEAIERKLEWMKSHELEADDVELLEESYKRLGIAWPPW